MITICDIRQTSIGLFVVQENVPNFWAVASGCEHSLATQTVMLLLISQKKADCLVRYNSLTLTNNL